MNTSEHASVHSLELRKQPHEVYEAFYNLYGSPEFQDPDGSLSRSLLLEGRVLHDDRNGQRDMHLIVRQRDGVHLPSSRRLGQGDTVQHVFPYPPGMFIVATTDGVSIERWQVVNSFGIHPGRIDTILNPYRPEKETVTLHLAGSTGNRAQLNFNREHGYGAIHLSDKSTKWILDSAESALERSRVLAVAPAVGHIATAS